MVKRFPTRKNEGSAKDMLVFCSPQRLQYELTLGMMD
jgi:hypothetical protein